MSYSSSVHFEKKGFLVNLSGGSEKSGRMEIAPLLPSINETPDGQTTIHNLTDKIK